MWARTTLLALAVVLHAGVGFVYVVSGLVAPPWAVVVLILAWIAMSLLLLRALRRGAPWPALAVPLGGGLLWVALVQGLGTLLDWTA